MTLSKRDRELLTRLARGKKVSEMADEPEKVNLNLKIDPELKELLQKRYGRKLSRLYEETMTELLKEEDDKAS